VSLVLRPPALVAVEPLPTPADEAVARPAGFVAAGRLARDRRPSPGTVRG
jgi:hypothetical protein